MLVMGKDLSLRLLSTLKLFALSICSFRQLMASFAMASLSFSQADALAMEMMPKILPQASKASSMSQVSSSGSTYTVLCRQLILKLPIGFSR